MSKQNEIKTFREKIATWFIEVLISVIKPVRHFFSLLDFCCPEYVLEIKEMAKENPPQADFEKELKQQLSKARNRTEMDTPYIFVMGEWGSGKTFQLLSFKEHVSKEEILYCPFWGIHSVQEGMLHTIPLAQRFLCLALLVNVVSVIFGLSSGFIAEMFRDKSAELYLAIIMALISVMLLIPGRWKIIYALISAVTYPLNTQRLVILDDVERSGLNNEEQWRMLLSLWRYNVQYIIPIGHDGGEAELKWRGIAAKLNSLVIDLHAHADAKRKWLKSNWPLAFFNSNEEWLAPFTLRELSVMAERYYDLTAEKEGLICNVIGLKLILDKTLEKMSVRHDEKRMITLSQWPPNDDKLSFRITSERLRVAQNNALERRLDNILWELSEDFKGEFLLALKAKKNLGEDLFIASPEAISQMALEV